MSEEAPTWQPISALPMLTAHVAEGARLAREHLDTLRHAPPYGMDDATLHGVIATFTRTREDLEDLFAEQGRRWRRESRGTRHQPDVEHYCALIEEERTLVAAILTRAEELTSVTIERLPAKSDLEIGLQALLGETPRSE